MSRAVAYPKLFAAVCLLFAEATLFNVTANATSSAIGVGAGGMGLREPVRISAPVLKVGPAIPPSPWDDDAPSVAGNKR